MMSLKQQKKFNEYFVNIVKKLRILTEEQATYSAANQLRKVEMAIIKYLNICLMNNNKQ